MSKLSYVFIAGLATAAGVNAGQFQIGGVNGLTTAYIQAGGSIGAGWNEGNYRNNLFQTATLTPTAGQANALPTNGVAGTFVDAANGVTFSTVNDVNTTRNYWASPTGGATNTTFVVPIGVSGPITDVYIMMNDYSGFAGSNPTVTFNFTGGSVVDVVPDLANGLGGIRSAVNCTAVTVPGQGITCPNPTIVPAQGATVVSSDSGSTNNLVAIGGGDTVTTKTLWTGTYSIAPFAANNYFYNANTGSTGNVMLDELHFRFAVGHALGDLTSISFLSASSTDSSTSRLAISAITVVTATPEPGTILLFATGLGVLGLGRLRTRKQ